MSSTIARNLVGRNVLLTGKATAFRLAAQGASLAISDVKEEAGRQVVGALSQKYPEQTFSFEAVDVTDHEQVRAHVSKVTTSASGGLQGLVCAAGIAIPGPRMHETSIDTYLKIMNVNMHGTFYYNHAVLAEFVRQNRDGKITAPEGGYAIVNIGSKAAVEGCPGAAAYCATKHGVLGMSRTNAKDYANENIRTNVICPGVTLTELIQGLIDSGRPELSVEHTLARVYMKRFGLPEEMAATIAHLIGPESSYTTGQALVVDGAWSP